MPSSIVALYAARAANGEIEHDSAQEAAAAQLDALNERLANYRLARKSSSLGWLFGAREPSEELLKGIYIYGEVGRGKTMLMDLFFAACPALRKRRAHFHEFMADVHDRIHAYRQKMKLGEITDLDPIAKVAGDLADEAWVLCFDEFHVTDIADAMILGRLFTRLFERGVVVVATSNLPPEALYQDGLNRALFLPFIALLNERMNVIRLGARADFRLEKLAGMKIWHVPADAKAKAAIEDAWQQLTTGHQGKPVNLPLKGRLVHVPLAAMGVARFSFHELCEQPLGAIDYLKIAHEFHTLIVERIPVMAQDARNEAKRFILLIDTLYDNAVKIVASSAAEPQHLYRGTDGFEVNEFKRTASRLIEMGSQAYLALPHGRHGITAPPSSAGLVET
ncbi:MAG: cell division protein ZapE [Xanthobacteraceae bacterium]